jgi:hypothetical protein
MAVKNKVTKIAVTILPGTFKYPRNRQKTTISAKTIATSRGISNSHYGISTAVEG